MKLVIVESPTKAKTIAKFLGKGWKVDSSYGHVRDLPKGKLGIDLEANFTPQYVVFRENQKRLTALKKAAQGADMVYYATDEDREGEAIAWHLAEMFDLPADRQQRITFHEVTARAITEAIEHPRQIDQHLVDAQQARRVLDRLVGYKLSPFLWKKVVRGLSAGRVQSVAVRLTVEREREIQAFQPQEYWTIEADFTTARQESFHAALHAVDGTSLDKFAIGDEAKAKELLVALQQATYQVSDVSSSESTKNPLPPFRTSTLQQEANRRLGFSAKLTMRIAQQLYEGVSLGSEGQQGLITYMRTDSLNLSASFLQAAKQLIVDQYGAAYAPDQPRYFKNSAKGAQEAHEAIRPAEVTRTPEAVAGYLTPQQLKLYRLIWSRAVASQMTPAQVASSAIEVGDEPARHVFRATGQTITFDGFLKVYATATKETILPTVTTGEAVTAQTIEPSQHFTQPPARYTDASLVKVLEEKGIGRPSTYAPTIATIVNRGYVTRDKRNLQPTDIAFVVNDLLVEHFPNIVDYDFTATIEDKLDAIADGTAAWQPAIREFFEPFAVQLEQKMEAVQKVNATAEVTDELCDKCGKPMVIKIGRFGKFLSCSGWPECKNAKPLGEAGQAAADEPTDEVCPTCGKPMVVKVGRFGKFIACSDYPTCKTTKKTAVSTGVTCPTCGEGELVERRSRRGVFYGCSQYPKCKTTLWAKPTGEKCATCGALTVHGKDDTVQCSNKECPTKKDE